MITACFLAVKLSREEALFSHSSPLAQMERRFIPGMNDQGFPARFAVKLHPSTIALCDFVINCTQAKYIPKGMG
jgi:hypothetical protein